jgi:Spy/CpxP family protein refolding chaperone
MKRTTVVILLGIAALHFQAQAQNAANPPQPGDRPARTEDRQGDRRPEEPRSLTAEQKAQVKSILSKYNESSLTADDARAINNAFRKAGLRSGPALQQAIRDAGFVPEKIGALAPPPDRSGEKRTPPDRPRPDQPGRNKGSPDRPEQGKGGGYSIEQAISDRAQLSTIAFDGLAFLTGDFGCNTFLPPGKVADFCGFQYMRDVDTNQLGHNTSFVPRAANNVPFILTDAQKAQLVALAKEQEKLLTDCAYKRFPLIRAFCRQLARDIPVGSAGLNREAVMKYTGEIFEIDGLLGYRRAQVLGGIVRALTDQQKAYLGKMVFNNSATWPELGDQVDKRSLSHTAHVAVMTYASEMFSWYAGSVEADVYFCPERHATYFGSFYRKDIPAMGNNNYSISTSLTGDSGEAFLAALTEPQRQLITSLVDRQRQDLNEIVQTRRAISTELRRFMKEDAVDKDQVLSLSRRYGELDGEISYYDCMAFAQVAKTLTADQKDTLLRLRNLDAKDICKSAYLYSRAIDMPEIPNTDFLFVASAPFQGAGSENVHLHRLRTVSVIGTHCPT